MPAAWSAEPSKYPFRCVTSPTTVRDSILIVGPPLSAAAGAGALAAAALSAAGGGIMAAPGAAALARSPDAGGGEAGGGAEDAGGTLFSIAASSCFSASHRSGLIADLIASPCAFSAASTAAASASSEAVARRAPALSPAPSAWLSVCASPAKLATGPMSALELGFALSSESRVLSEFKSSKAWLLRSAEAALGSVAARAAGMDAHISAHDIAPSSAQPSAHRQPRCSRTGVPPVASIVRRYIKEVLQEILPRNPSKKSF